MGLQAQASAPVEEGQSGAGNDSSFLIWEDRGGDAGAAAPPSDDDDDEEEEEREEVGRKAGLAAAVSDSEEDVPTRGAADPDAASDEGISLLAEEGELPEARGTGRDRGALPAPGSTAAGAAPQQRTVVPSQVISCSSTCQAGVAC